MNKIYKSKQGNFSTNVGNRQRITFAPCGDGGIFMTKNRELQEAIEGDPDFNELFSLISEESEELPENSYTPVVVETVTNVIEAKTYLSDHAEEYNIYKSEIKNKEGVLRIAKMKGIEFPNLA